MTILSAHPEIPWRLIIATRNRLIHGYLGIDGKTIWRIIRDDNPRGTTAETWCFTKNRDSIFRTSLRATN